MGAILRLAAGGIITADGRRAVPANGTAGVISHRTVIESRGRPVMTPPELPRPAVPI